MAKYRQTIITEFESEHELPLLNVSGSVDVCDVAMEAYIREMDNYPDSKAKSTAHSTIKMEKIG